MSTQTCQSPMCQNPIGEQHYVLCYRDGDGEVTQEWFACSPEHRRAIDTLFEPPAWTKPPVVPTVVYLASKTTAILDPNLHPQNLGGQSAN
jgi:hypothetical protein